MDVRRTLMSYLDRLKGAANRAGAQASIFAQNGFAQLGEGARNVQDGFRFAEPC